MWSQGGSDEVPIIGEIDVKESPKAVVKDRYKHSISWVSEIIQS